MEGNVPPGAEGAGPQFQQQPSPHAHQHHQSDGIVNDVRFFLLFVLQEFGWGILLLCWLMFMAYNKISNSLNTPASARSPSTADAGRSEDPEKILERQEKIAAARAKMQAVLDEKVEEEKIKMREREEQARQKKIQEWDNLQSGKGYYSKMKNTTEPEITNKPSSDKPLKSKTPLAQRDFNPLMGDSSSSSSSWRPAARRSGGG